MAVLVVAYLPDTSVEQDRSFAEALGFLDGSAAGCRFRITGPWEESGRRMITLWDSQEAFERWRDERLATTLHATSFPVPRFEVWPIDFMLGLE